MDYFKSNSFKKRRELIKTSIIFPLMFLCNPSEVCAGILNSPVGTNRLRPPGAVSEEIFAGKCIRCGRCVEACPYKSIILLDIKNGVYSGTPLIIAEKIPCYLCMKCVAVCPTGSLKKIKQEETRMGLAVINKHVCVTWKEETICRTCYNVCLFKDKAIRLDELRPVIDEKFCVGCGLCAHGCPVSHKNNLKAINIEPIYSQNGRTEQTTEKKSKIFQ